MPMLRLAQRGDGAVERVHPREQRGRSMALIVVVSRAGTTELQRRTLPGAIEQLDLAFLVATEHERPLAPVQVQPHYVQQLAPAEPEAGRHLFRRPVHQHHDAQSDPGSANSVATFRRVDTHEAIERNP